MLELFLVAIFALLLWCSSIKLLLIFILLIVLIIAFYSTPLKKLLYVFDEETSHDEDYESVDTDESSIKNSQ